MPSRPAVLLHDFVLIIPASFLLSTERLYTEACRAPCIRPSPCSSLRFNEIRRYSERITAICAPDTHFLESLSFLLSNKDNSPHCSAIRCAISLIARFWRFLQRSLVDTSCGEVSPAAPSFPSSSLEVATAGGSGDAAGS